MDELPGDGMKTETAPAVTRAAWEINTENVKGKTLTR